MSNITNKYGVLLISQLPSKAGKKVLNFAATQKPLATGPSGRGLQGFAPPYPLHHLVIIATGVVAPTPLHQARPRSGDRAAPGILVEPPLALGGWNLKRHDLDPDGA